MSNAASPIRYHQFVMNDDRGSAGACPGAEPHWQVDFELPATVPGRLRNAFKLAGRNVQLIVAGGQLGDALAHPFAHLPRGSETVEPDLTISVKGRSESGPPPIDSYAAGHTWSHYGHRVTASPDGRFVAHFIERSGSVWCLDRMTRRITGFAEGGDRLTLYERGKTAQLLLPFWLETHGLELIHSALIARKGRGVLISGPNGAGKSTSALSCLIAGFDYLGDDYIVLEGNPHEGFQGHSVYGCAFLEPHHLLRFPALIPYAVSGPYPSELKRLVLLHRAFPAQLAASARLQFLLLPRIGSRPTAVTRATKAEALRQLAPSSLLMLARPNAVALTRMAALVEQLDCFWLDLGPDIEAIPTLVEKLLDL